MAIISTEASAETIGNLITRIRRAVGDTETLSANQRWTDAEVIDAMNLEMFKMSAELGIGNIAAVLSSTTMTYTASSDSVALPSGPDVNAIFMVEDYRDSDNPIRLDFASVLDADVYDVNSAHLALRGIRWSRRGSSLVIRPKPAADMTLRIWYIRPPFGTSTSYSGTDQQPFPVHYEELISVGAAIRLQEVDGEIPSGRVERYVELWSRFVRSKYQNKGPISVRRNRRYR